MAGMKNYKAHGTRKAFLVAFNLLLMALSMGSGGMGGGVQRLLEAITRGT